MGMPVGSDAMSAAGSRDPNSAYSTSAPSPTSAQAMLSGRPKRRTDVYGAHESPYFYQAQQFYRLCNMNQSASLNIKISARIDRGFFLAANDWTCYRRNYFQISASFSIQGHDASVDPETPCLLERNGELSQVNQFLICIGAQIQHGEKTIDLVQHTPKRDKGPQITPRPVPVRAGGDLSMYSTGSSPNVVTFERVQFKTATANNGKRRAAQQYYQVHVDLFAELDSGELVLVANSLSAPLVVRGRSPGHYADTDEGAPASSTQPLDTRYAYRNGSISSSSNGGGPVSPVGSEYSYYPYGYSSTYTYQSLGSASHIATQPQDTKYYERRDSESYPASPMTPVGRHPGAIEAQHHSHPYMASQVHHGFSTASVSPDMYSTPSFIAAGTDGPASFNRPSHLQDHPGQDGHYPYGSAYSQYAQQQQDHYDDERDHEALAALHIHSPVTPGSPITSARRQSFSSLTSKKVDRGVIGPTRKSRSISMSGISKRTPSKTRPSRTVPVTPTKELTRGLGITSDHILEEEQP
ncbi:hypothetical protein B0O80DRAFT_43527 [Mortierella sp. GBAus27b]|nr:hypothetical protein B0O80DRAFT_43527 [Mortierella sp. GBAus27b]